MNNQERVTDIGEYGLVERIKKMIDHDPSTPLTYGDDATAFYLDQNTIVANADMFVGSTDIPPGMSFKQVGAKVVTMAVSDLAAKGVGVRAFLLSVGLPKDFLVNDFDQIIHGVNQAIRQYDGWFLGGDINQANDLILDGIAIGHGSRVIPRTGIHSKDVLFVTGKFGDTAAGLDLLLNNRTYLNDFRHALVKSVYEPKAQVKIGQQLSQIPEIIATLDSSDGLARSLHILASINDVGITIDYLPITDATYHYANQFHFDPIDLALYGGEEFHLVGACRASAWPEIQAQIPSAIKIGFVNGKKKSIVYVPQGAHEVHIEDRGWEHFKTK